MFKGKVLATLSVSAIISAALAASVYAYTPTSVSHIDWMQKKSIVVGNQHGSVSLEKHVTTAEYLTIVARLKGETKLPPSKAIAGWASGVLAWGEKNGYITKQETKAPNAVLSAKRIVEIGKKAGYELKLDTAASSVTRKDVIQALGQAATLHITIGHTNDVHGHIEENKNLKELGYAKIATLIKQMRAENPNFLLMDAGDTFQGTVFANLFKGESIVPILNALDYDAQAAGNHEFDFGYEQLLKLEGMVEHPIISANIFKIDGTELLQPVHFAQVGGKKIAIVGFTTVETPIVTHPDNVKGLVFKDPIEIAKKLVPELKKQADQVIVVGHNGIEADRAMARAVPGIDLIIGGHSHTPLEKPENVNGTYIVQDWEYGKSLGRADLYYWNKDLVAFDGGLIPYDENIKPDPEVEKLVKDVISKIDGQLNVKIATAAVDLVGDRNFVRTQETNLGNLISDALLAKSKTLKGYEADIAVTNGGGIRSLVKAGDVTKKSLYDVLPFPNTLVITELTGAELKEVLENGVSRVENAEGRFLQVSGVTFKFSRSLPAGQRVSDIKVGGAPVDLSRTYKLATNDFIVAGGDGFSVLMDNKSFNTGLTMYEVVEEAIIKQGTLKPAVEGRIVEIK
ncbi:bifunctional metallophosphatase/5'-nucleotidase [Paenibacillus sp. GCM10027627]|uniref:bifunctional metallophosphatase/5'-nucleotidase n=1 Tax=unclassified Paenibacillus TaxID=185978 RepID=UPI00363F9AA9